MYSSVSFEKHIPWWNHHQNQDIFPKSSKNSPMSHCPFIFYPFHPPALATVDLFSVPWIFLHENVASTESSNM